MHLSYVRLCTWNMMTAIFSSNNYTQLKIEANSSRVLKDMRNIKIITINLKIHKYHKWLTNIL